jgi:hypothetical protein
MIKSSLYLSLHIMEMEDGRLWASLYSIKDDAPVEPIWSIEACSDASLLFLELLTVLDGCSFTYLATTTDGQRRPLADRIT